jgi:1-pyrroline-5-carboxylate dehydrogenase
MRLTYTSGAPDKALDAAFQQRLAELRAATPEPLPHVLAGEPLAEGPVFERRDPARTDSLASRAHEATPPTVARAVACARAACRTWRNTPFQERCARLRALARELERNQVELAATVSLETGKIRSESLAEVIEAVDLIETYSAQVERAGGFTAPLSSLSPGEHNTDTLRPYGVFGVIAPFNFPLALAVNMTAAALLAGNAVVLKPSEAAPRAGAALAKAMRAAQLPPGVFNLVHGGPDTGRALAAPATGGTPALGGAPATSGAPTPDGTPATSGAPAQSQVDAIAFTGSAEVGREIAARLAAGPYPRPVVAEMGGKNPAIVTARADLDKAAEGIARAAFGLSGQKCSSCSRAIVFEQVHDELLEKLVSLTATFAVGDPADPAAALGPVVDERAVQRFRRSVELAEADGRVLAGAGVRPGGHFVEPTVVGELAPGHELTRRELFLPFVAVTPVPDLQAALAEANAVQYGLTAAIFSEDRGEVDAFLDEIQAGILYVNRRAGATTGAWPGVQSFCGWKSSGLTGKGGLGPYYVQQFMREQSRTIMD